MRGRSSSSSKSKQVISKVRIEAETLEETQPQPQLSGAYIRSLVKQLTSSTTTQKKDNNPKELHAQKLSKDSQVSSDNQTPPRPYRKKVRRRLNTSRPYQERLLNMAEARREIVAALKFHRASMKQQEAEKEQKQLVFPEIPTPQQSRGNPRIYTSNTGIQSFEDSLENISYSSLSHLARPFPWNTYPPMEICPENLDTLPIGLNLNFQDFGSLNSTSLYHHNNNQSILSYSSSSSSPPLSVNTPEEVIPTGEGINFGGGGCFHPVMNDEVMEEIRSIGEQHQMEWDDTMNLVTSAWWFKFLKSMDFDNQEIKLEDNNNDVYQFSPFDQVMEFPSWINANEVCLLQPLNGYSSQDNFQESSLPCMEIGDFEATDVEWLS